MELTSRESIGMNPMELLPTEILQQILGYLPLNERIRAERVCKRWKNVSTEQVWRDVHVLYIFPSECRAQYHKFRDSKMKLGGFIMMEDDKVYIGTELEIIQSFLTRAGKHIKELILDVTSIKPAAQLILSIIAAHCHNIEVIQLLHICNSSIEAFSELLKVNRQLHSFSCITMDNFFIERLPLRDWKTLRIGFLYLDADEWNTELVTLVENSPSLEKFYVNSWTLNLSAAISKCKQLKTLHFPPWRGAAAYDLMRNTSLLNRLTRLRMDGRAGDDSLIIELLSHCINLKSLKLVHFSDEGLPPALVKAVMALPMLKSLTLDASSVTDEILSRLLKFKHLRVFGGDNKFTEEGIFNVIRYSKDLENLEMPEMRLSQSFLRRLKNTGRRKILKIEVPTDLHDEALKICKGSKICVIEGLNCFERRIEI